MGLSVIAARIWLGIQFGVAGTRVRNWLSLAIALAGMPSIDAKLAWRDPSLWQPLSATTSIAPFLAIAVVAWATMLHLHPFLFDVAPVAM